MPSEQLKVRTTPVRVQVPDSSSSLTIQNVGGGTLYYRSTQSVSSVLNDGSIAAGSSYTTSADVWVVSSSTSQLALVRPTSGSASLTAAQTFTAEQTLSGGIKLGNSTGDAAAARIRVPNPVSGRGQLVIDAMNIWFDSSGVRAAQGVGTADPIMVFGYNEAAEGGLILAGEGAASVNVEGHYDDPSSAAFFSEVYFQFRAPDGLSSGRPVFTQYNKTTNRITAVALRAEAIALDYYEGTRMVTITPGSHLFEAKSGTDNVLRVKAVTGFAAQFGLSHGTTDDRLVFKTNSTTQSEMTVGGVTCLRFYSRDSGTASALALGGPDDANSTVHIQPDPDRLVSAPVLTVKHQSDGTGDLTVWRDPSNNIGSTISENGYFTTRKTSAPADAELSNSELAIWLTDAPGGTLANFKAKDSAGTVKSATVALA